MLNSLIIFLTTIVVMKVVGCVMVYWFILGWLNTLWHCSYITNYLTHSLADHSSGWALGLFLIFSSTRVEFSHAACNAAEANLHFLNQKT